MFKYQPSIRQKITLGYYAIVAIIIGLSLFTFMELRFVEKKILFGGVISEFFDTTLEIRRFEKNYIIYEQRPDYEENIKYVAAAQALLENNIKGFTAIASDAQITELRDNLRLYKDLMERYTKRDKDNIVLKMLLERDIRQTGKDIVTVAEDISKTERRNLQTMLTNSRDILIFSIISLSFLGIAIGQALSKMVVKPLKSLEESMRVISEGRFEAVSINSKDAEIVSLANAFNKMLKELELRQRHLIQSEKLASLGTLLSGVAHELNNPLSNISSSCQILAEEIEEDDMEYKKELISQIDDQTDRARNIVRSLLEFSRDKEFKKEKLPLKVLFEETIKFIKGQVPTKVAVVLNIPEDLLITADKQRMQQAFLNLIKNAIEAVPEEGKVTVTARKIVGEKTIDKEESLILECRDYMPAGDRESAVYIKVSDTGKGIEPEIVPKIFDPFFTTKDVGKGSGLGLFIVHEIIEEHDGCIVVESKPGEGTKFIIRLPLKE